MRGDPHHCVLIRSRIWKGFLIRKRCLSYQLDQRYILWKVHSFALKETFWNHVLLRLTPSKQLIILSKPSQYERGNENFLIAFTPPMLIRCHGLAYLNFLLLSKKERKREEVWKGKCFHLAFAFLENQLFSCSCLLFMNDRGKKTHYCGPDGNIPHDQTNQSPWWDAGVTQPCSNTPFHSLSGTNTWSPINGTPRTHEDGCFTPAFLVHGWWLHNHTSILSKEKGDELPSTIPHHVSNNTVMDTTSVQGSEINMLHYAFTCGSPPPWSLLTLNKSATILCASSWLWETHQMHTIWCGVYRTVLQASSMNFMCHVLSFWVLSLSLSLWRFAAERSAIHPLIHPSSESFYMRCRWKCVGWQLY